MQYRYAACAAWTFSKDIKHGHVAMTCSMDIEARTGSIDMQHGHAACTCSTYMKHGLAERIFGRTSSKVMQEGHAAEMQQGHPAWT
jgi:hypothetical protein